MVRYLTWYNQFLGTYELSLLQKEDPIRMVLSEMRHVMMTRMPPRPKSLWGKVGLPSNANQRALMSQEDKIDYTTMPLRCVVVYQNVAVSFPTLTVVPVESGLKWSMLSRLQSDVRVEVCDSFVFVFFS
jgi:hypothetical protein